MQTLLRKSDLRLVMIGMLGLCAAARAQSIAIVQPAPGYQYSSAFYAAPGGAVVGISYNQGLYAPHPTRWTSAAAPAELLGVPGIGGGGEPYRCSDDGQVVVGRWLADANTSTPAMWGPSGAYTALPGPGTVSEANGVSADGSVLTGWSATSQGRWLLRWHGGVQTQMFGPAFVSGPCSPDGNTALGVTYLGGSSAALSRWTIQGGPNGSVQPLGQFPATWTNILEPAAMTPTADAAVGLAYPGTNSYQSWIWRNGQIASMGVLSGYYQMYARGISADGNLVAGIGLVQLQPFVFDSHAVVWTPGSGWAPFSDWLAARGVSFPGWTFRELRSVSADGLTFAGSGLSPQGQVRGFVMTIPGPGAGAVLLAGLVGGLVVRRRR